MKRAVVLMLALCLVLSVSAMGQDEVGLKGKMLVSGYGGYTIGVGDPWGEQTLSGTLLGVPFEIVEKLDPTISFGGMFHYGVSDKLMVGGELGFQIYDQEASGSVAGIPLAPESATETKLNVLFNGLYAINYVEDEQGFFVTFGGGIYGGLGGVLDLQQAWDDAIAGKEVDEDGVAFGFNGGFLYTKMVSPTVGLFVMPRFHFVLSDPSSKMFQIAAGVQIPIGN